MTDNLDFYFSKREFLISDWKAAESAMKVNWIFTESACNSAHFNHWKVAESRIKQKLKCFFSSCNILDKSILQIGKSHKTQEILTEIIQF